MVHGMPDLAAPSTPPALPTPSKGGPAGVHGSLCMIWQIWMTTRTNMLLYSCSNHRWCWLRSQKCKRTRCVFTVAQKGIVCQIADNIWSQIRRPGSCTSVLRQE